MELNLDLNMLETEPAGQYHAQAKRFLSSHQLLDFIRCPWLHHKKAAGNGKPDKSRRDQGFE
jgi:hypothetical protein